MCAVKERAERDITRRTGTEHCKMTYLIEKNGGDALLEPASDRWGTYRLKRDMEHKVLAVITQISAQ